MLSDIWTRLRSLFRRRTVEDELDDELRFHFDQQVEKYVRSGMTRDEATRRARLEFGGLDQVKEQCRDARGVRLLETFLQDTRYGLRMLRKSPGFTSAAILTLALGIGANTAIFSIANALVLRRLPVYAPNQVASLVRHDKASGSDGMFSYPDFDDIRDQSGAVFTGLAAVQPYQMDGFRMGEQSEPLPMWTNYVTTNFFQVMGIKPALGTFFQPHGQLSSADPIIVLGYSFWKNHLGADPNVAGRSVSVNGRPVTVLGVAPKGFYGLFSIIDTQGYLPMGMAVATGDSKPDFIADRHSSGLVIVGRLHSAMTTGQAAPPLSVVARRLSDQHPDNKWDWLQAFPIGPLGPVTDWSGQEIIDAMAAFFLVLVGLILVLAWVNVANLLLVRATAREREMAVRSALGASRNRIVRQVLTESLLLALFGCAAGLFLGAGVSRSIGSVNLSSALPLTFDFAFDWRVFAYGIGAALLAGLLVGMTPAFRAARGNLNDLLRDSPRTATSRRQGTRSVLVVAQLGGSLMLLIVAGLFVRSLRFAERSDLGFDPVHVVNLSVAPTEAGYHEPQARQFLEDLLQRVRALPGVESASLATSVPMGYYSNGYDNLQIEGFEPVPGQGSPHAGCNSVSTGYFHTMRIALLRGRTILDSDSQNSKLVAVINEEMATRYWPHRDALGGHFTLPTDRRHPIEVVGVVKNVRNQGLTGPIGPFFYRPLAQDYSVPITLQLRTTMPPAPAIRDAATVIRSLAPAMPIFDMQSMTQALNTLAGLLLYRLGAVLTASLGALGLALALVGVYGVVSYAASQRTHEIGIRMALGAQPRQALKTILGQGLLVSGAGILVGAVLAGVIGQLARDFLSGVSPMDPLTYLGASALLAVVALLACYFPARRAMRVDPMVALRHE
jgi:putative ABC transport system permease protein